MTQLTIDNFKTMLATALSNIKAREDEFSKPMPSLVTVIMDKPSRTYECNRYHGRKRKEFKTMLNDMGFDVMMQVSGSTQHAIRGFLLRDERPCKWY